MKIAALYISPGHNYFGRHGKPPGEHPLLSVPSVECLAGRGIAGDRFLDYKDNYAGQITFFAGEVYDEIQQALHQRSRPAAVFRRNVLTRGADLNALIGEEFAVQGVRFLGTRECSPCYWMDQAFAPGAEAWLKGRGGLRAKILTSGWLKVDAAC
jgi:MOSC domain-containing protein YiiM